MAKLEPLLGDMVDLSRVRIDIAGQFVNPSSRYAEAVHAGGYRISLKASLLHDGNVQVVSLIAHEIVHIIQEQYLGKWKMNVLMGAQKAMFEDVYKLDSELAGMSLQDLHGRNFVRGRTLEAIAQRVQDIVWESQVVR